MPIISVRVGKHQLKSIDSFVNHVYDSVSEDSRNGRSRLLVAAALRVAEKIEKNEKIDYIESDLTMLDGEPTTMNVSVSEEDFLTIQKAAKKMGHRISTFVLFAITQAMEKHNGSY